jgi:hypothetical protein
MKKILAIAAVAALTAGVSAYGANPFSDVTPDDWAYQAVSDLSDQGVVEGYPDGTFKGERNMTRYELAQIIARLMAKEDQLNAEQRATLDKLAGEYADELANLGVRVGNLEKKVGNLYWSGDARMQYQHNLDGAKNHADTWNGRMRINVKADVNDQVTVNGRFVNEMDFKGSDDSNTYMDRLYTEWTPTDQTYVRIGRQGVALDQTGTFWDEDGVFDGINAAWDNGKIGVEAGYGRFKDGYKTYDIDDEDWDDSLADAGFTQEGNGFGWKDQASTEAWYAKLTGHIADRADVSAFYMQPTHDFNSAAYKAGKAAGLYTGDSNAKVWGVGANVDLGGNFTLDGDYVKTQWSGKLSDGDTTYKADDPALWTAGLTYGAVDTDKPGTWQLGVHYVKADAGSYLLGNSALDLTDQLDYGWNNWTDVHFWVARAGVALQKNVELDAYYNFAAKASGNNQKDPDDTWGVELNYAF